MADIFPGAQHIPASGYFPRTVPNANLAFSVIHTTAGLAGAAAQATYSARAGSQVTATFWVDRDGSVVQSFADPLRQGPWTNGVWQNPDTSNARIAACFNAGVNPNLRTLVSIENVSLEPGAPITAEQEATCARIIKHYHDAAGVPITRQSVIGHYQITAIDRPNCPARDKSVIDRIVAMANGEIPAGGNEVYKEITYPGSRDWNAKGGVTHGYKFSDEPNKDANLAAGSSAHSSAEVTISPTPPDWLPGPYQQVSDGVLAGFLVANSQMNLGPVPTVPKPPTTDDCVEKTAPLWKEIATLTEQNKALTEEIAAGAAAFKTLSELGK